MNFKVVVLLAVIAFAVSLPVKTNKRNARLGKANAAPAAAVSGAVAAAAPAKRRRGFQRIVPAVQKGMSAIDAEANYHRRRREASPARRSSNWAPWAKPDHMNPNEVKMILRWNTSDVGGIDLDALVIDPNGCVAAWHSSNFGECWNDLGGYVISGRTNNPMDVTPYEGARATWNNPVVDSTSSSAGPNGVESIVIGEPIPGIYKHMVYQYGDTSEGFTLVPDAEVDFWTMQADDPGIAWLYSSFYLYEAAGFMYFCEGRFWNTFQMEFTLDPRGGDDDNPSDPISSFVLTNVNNLSSTPQWFLGTSATQGWEIGTRTTQNC